MMLETEQKRLQRERDARRTRYEVNLQMAIERGLHPGTVACLTTTVLNPTPDRRQRRDWRKLHKVAAGQRFQFVFKKDGDGDEVVLELRDILRMPLQLSLDSDLFERMVPHLQPEESTLDDVLHFRGTSARDALQSLIDRGRIELAELLTITSG